MTMTLRHDFTAPNYDDANDQIVAAVGAALNVSRPSTAKVRDYLNVLKTVKANEPRFTGARRVENLCRDSETLSGATWNDINVTTTPNAIANPLDAAVTAELVTLDSTSSVKFFQNTTFSFAAGIQTTASIYLKAGTQNFIAIRRYKDVNKYFLQVFDLSDGTLGEAKAGSTSGTQTGAGIESLGGGWYRCWVSGNMPESAYRMTVMPVPAKTGNTFDVAGQVSWTSAAQTLYAYGAQVEDITGQDDPAPSEYIPTTTAEIAKWYNTARRTNFCLRSQTFNFGDPPWQKVRIALTANDAVAPDGTTTATRFDETGDTGAHYLNQVQTPVVRGRTYTCSVYAKAEENASVQLMPGATGFADDVFANFDLSDGTVGTSNGVDDYGIEPASATYPSAPAGWYRCWMTITADATSAATNPLLIVLTESDADARFASYAGTVGDGIFIWGAQIERGAEATAYIVTTSTRASSGFDTEITPTGLLIEEARTNLIQQSEAFEVSPWSLAADTTITANAAVAPDGLTTADKLGGDGTGAAISTAQAKVKAASAITYSYSIYAKKENLEWLQIALFDGASTGTRAWFDLNTGVVGSLSDIGAGFTLESSVIENAGDGWYRCTLICTSNTATNLVAYVYPVAADLASATDTTDGIYIWGAQLEAGAFPTSYIPTTTATVSRSRDSIGNNSDFTWQNTTAFSIYIAFVDSLLDTSEQTLIDARDADSSESFRLRMNNVSGLPYCITVSSQGGAQTGGLSGGVTPTPNVLHRIAIGVSTDDAALYSGGVQRSVDSAIDVPGDFTKFSIDSTSGSGTDHRNGHVQEIRYYDERLSNQVIGWMSEGIFDVLVLENASHSVAVDGVALSSAQTLVVADALQAIGVDIATITSKHLLAIADCIHAVTEDGITLVPTLNVADALHATTVDSMFLARPLEKFDALFIVQRTR